MRVVLLTTDDREHYKDYSAAVPYFGAAPEALLQGFAAVPELTVHVVSCARAKLSSPDKLAPNIFFHSLYVPRMGWMRTAYQGCIRAVRRELNQIRPDIVHGQGTERDCALSAVFSGAPNVITIHGNMAQMARLFKARPGSFGWLAARLENFALRRTAGVFCNSEHTERLVRPRTGRTWRVPNAVREQFFAPADRRAGASKCTILNVGLVSPNKRQLELLDVAGELRQQGLDFEFQFVGHAEPGNPYAAAFLDKIKPMEKGGFARYVGPKSSAELVRLFDGSAALVHFPSEEAFGLVVAEAQARSVKVFGARTGGIVDIAAEVKDAELFGVEDWRGLTSAIAGWIRGGSPRAQGGAELVRARYHPLVIAQRHVEIYREVLVGTYSGDLK